MHCILGNSYFTLVIIDRLKNLVFNLEYYVKFKIVWISGLVIVTYVYGITFETTNKYNEISG